MAIMTAAGRTGKMPPDLAGAIGVYVESHRAMLHAWSASTSIDTRIQAAFREDNAAGAAVLEIIFRRFGGDVAR